MLNFHFDQDKALAAILYISRTLIDNGFKADFHKVFKIFYFADQQHLSKYGRPITGDYYVAMQNGPVPSKIYDILKIVKGESIFKDQNLSQYFKVVNRYNILPQSHPDMDEFSDSDLECINRSIKENQSLSFNELTKKSHDSAWERAEKDNKISYQNMAKVVGASKDMLLYIRTVAENEKIAAAII